MIDVRPVAHSIGRLTAVFGALMVAPGVVDWWAGDPHWQVFAEVGLICALLGALVAIATAGRGGELMLEQAFLLTSGVWLVLPVVGALPFVMGEPHASFVDALFEAMSGMTTTGATAFPDLDGLPLGTHLWRAMLQWTGGLGIIVVAMLFLPVMRIGGMQFFRSRPEELHAPDPHHRKEQHRHDDDPQPAGPLQHRPPQVGAQGQAVEIGERRRAGGRHARHRLEQRIDEACMRLAHDERQRTDDGQHQPHARGQQERLLQHQFAAAPGGGDGDQSAQKRADQSDLREHLPVRIARPPVHHAGRHHQRAEDGREAADGMGNGADVDHDA